MNMTCSIKNHFLSLPLNKVPQVVMIIKKKKFLITI